jgi:glycosyltransferase involved in cell wall biosynthesis
MSEENTFLTAFNFKKKYKVITLSDHPLAPSGVGVQARFLIDGLVKTGQWSFRCLGGAMKHAKYDTVAVNPDFIVKPVDGFGSKELIRQLLITEQPDAIFLFTDPRQFIWLWEMEDEIHQVCPIVYWHVWDNDPYPAFNFPWYESTDLINCLSYKTFELVKPHFPEKTNYIPHTFPKGVYNALPEEQIKQFKQQNFGPKADWFKALWVNRNATRKMPNDVLFAWKTFLDDLQKKEGHRNAILIMHTDPADMEGPNLLAVSDMLGLNDNVWFSNDRLQFEQMNVMHNLVDTTINVAKNEGFGLSTLISLQVGKPIIALKTGGETRQVEDYRNGYQYGVAIEPAKRSLVGSQMVPYIFEDFCTERQVADAFMEIYNWTPEKKAEFREKAAEYLEHEFNYENMVQQWHETMLKCVEDFKAKKEAGQNKRWKLQGINPAPSNKLINIK